MTVNLVKGQKILLEKKFSLSGEATFSQKRSVVCAELHRRDGGG